MPTPTQLSSGNQPNTTPTQSPVLARVDYTRIYFHGHCGRRISRQNVPMKLIVRVADDRHIRSLSCTGPNEVAFNALAWALELALAQRKTHVLLRGHNKIVIDLVNRIKQPRDERMISLLEKYDRLSSQFEWLRVCYVPKKKNHAASYGPN